MRSILLVMAASAAAAHVDLDEPTAAIRVTQQQVERCNNEGGCALITRDTYEALKKAARAAECGTRT